MRFYHLQMSCESHLLGRKAELCKVAELKIVLCPTYNRNDQNLYIFKGQAFAKLQTN